MHVTDVDQVLLALRVDADCVLPFVNEGENASLCRRWEEGWALGKALDELIEEFLCGNLEVEGVANILDEVVQEIEGK